PLVFPLSLHDALPTLGIYADVVLRPAFAQDDIERLKERMRAGIASARQDPGRAASRLTMPLLFGRDHAYGRLLDEAGVDALERRSEEHTSELQSRENL